MIKFFSYDNKLNKVIVNEPEILLVKEFADLWTNERNKCKEDPTGTKKLRGFKELVYIYLAIDWGAPGAKDMPETRHTFALESSGLTEEEFNDPVFRAACNKYRELQDSSSLLGKLIETYSNNIHKMRIMIENIDYSERDESGKPIFKIKDTLAEMSLLSKALDALKQLEQSYKNEKEESSGLRGDKEEGEFD